MICPNCKTANDDEYVFCVNCGGKIVPDTAQSIDEPVPPTVRYIPQQQGQSFAPENSVQTVISPPIQYRPAVLKYDEAARPPQQNRSRTGVKIVVLSFAALILLGVLGVAGYIALTWPKPAVEALPDHLGMFAQNAERNRVDEIKKQDFANAIEGKDTLLKDDTLPALDSSPNFILFSDGKDVPISDLRLIQLDTMKDDGSLKQIDFQASPVEGKPEMKRLKIPDGVANGKYSFALIDGFLNDGKHKFWPFQVKNSAKSDNATLLKAATVNMKPTPSPSPTATKVPAPTAPAVPPPSGGTVAYCTTNNLVLRSGPSQSFAKVRNLRRGEKVYVFRYSDNAEIFNGILSKFAYIQTEGGQTGWVFAAFLR